MATRSIENVVWRTRRPFTYANPSRTARTPRVGVCSPGTGGIGRIIMAARNVAPYVTASIPYAQENPNLATMMPPRAGPATIVAFHSTWFRATADARWSLPTTLATVAVRVGESIPPRKAVIATAT